MLLAETSYRREQLGAAMSHQIRTGGIAAGVLLMLSAGAWPQDGPRTKPAVGDEAGAYFAIIGTEAPAFERGDENPGIVASKAPGGTVVLWLNGDPIGLYTGGAVIQGLHPGVRAGRNELTVSGKRRMPIYAVIVRGRLKDNKSLGAAGKVKFDAPAGDAREKPLVFQ